MGVASYMDECFYFNFLNVVINNDKGDVAALTRSSLICWENNTPKNKTMDPSPENNRAAWYQGPMKLEVVKVVLYPKSEFL